MTNTFLGQNLKHLRNLQKLTQKELASKIDISYYTYNNWENDLREPDLLSLKKFSIYYDLLIDELVNTQIISLDSIEIQNHKLDMIKNLEKKDVLKPLEENLKRLRSLKGLSRKKIAEELNTPYSTYAGWENGFREPDISTLNNIASYHKVSINDLLNPEAAVRDEDTLKLISRLSKNLFETYISVPDEHRAELEKKLIAYMNEFKSQKKIK
ncbi:transcriptional regulator [Bacillus toyonensis]|uniref:helix-turn-helix domain-containing protein n=1 Tax=Bacillus toyonensis TaxID=155322 RepID=UPI000BEF237B|nr:helix-turn-helix transcriptional regulator [Bacillus toyonensis]PEK75582.1 transcriptional regulator [Bacillus toyonensis]PFY54878.1 transcriptional regulator [Bacillus toyonensis]PGD14267.1 transcriptional regulator [Bacillus toyonensis]PHD49093.1 transcriptional regulator [Bacillus toyonensis]